MTKTKVEKLLDAIREAVQECDAQNNDAFYMPHTGKAIFHEDFDMLFGSESSSTIHRYYSGKNSLMY